MLGRQSGSRCSDDYRVSPGDPCVPAGQRDTVSCDDLDARDIEVVGVDVYRLDGNDQDGWGCESSVTGAAAPEDGTELGAYLQPLAATLVGVVALAGAVLWVRSHRRATDEAERRADLVGIYGAISLGALAVALGILGWA